MTSRSADGSRSDAPLPEPDTTPEADKAVDVDARIAQLREEIARFSLELARCEASQVEYRAKEDPVKRISHATEIFDLQQDKLRLRVEIELLEKKIRRLQLGYAEDAVPADPNSHPLF